MASPSKNKKLKIQSLPSNEEGKEEEATTSISDLPDDILHHIISFFDMESLLNSMLLSTRWKSLVKSLPCVHLKYHVSKNKNCSIAVLLDLSESKICSFTVLVDKVLGHLSHKSHIKSFHLDTNYVCDPKSERPSSWISFAAKRRVEEIRLSLFSFRRAVLPRNLFNCQTLTVLQVISGHEFYLTIKIGNDFNVCLPQLQVLHLERLCVRDGDWIGQIIANCPLVETLVINHCHVTDLSKLSVCSLHLKKLILGIISKHVFNSNGSEIKICAPNLTSLSLSADVYKDDYFFENLTSLVTADIDLYRACSIYRDYSQGEIAFGKMEVLLNSLSSARNLRLMTYVTVKMCQNIYTPTLFQNLRCLELKLLYRESCMFALRNILKNSQQLETLIIEMPGESNSELKFQLQGTMNHLKTLVMKTFEGSAGELKFLKIMLKNAQFLERIKFTVSRRSTRMKNIMKKKYLKKFLRASPSILVSFIHSKTSLEIVSFHVSNK